MKNILTRRLQKQPGASLSFFPANPENLASLLLNCSSLQAIPYGGLPHETELKHVTIGQTIRGRFRAAPLFWCAEIKECAPQARRCGHFTIERRPCIRVGQKLVGGDGASGFHSGRGAALCR